MKRPPRLHSLLVSACAFLACGTSLGATADAAPFPTHPIRLVVPFTSGGIADVMSRVLAEKLKESLGQSVVVENRPGAGTMQGLNDVVAGHAQVMFADLAAADAFIKAGKLTALGLTSAQPSPSRPQWQTIAQAGLPGYASTSWLGLLAPANTPPQVIGRLNEAVLKALRNGEVKARFAALNVDLAPSSPEAFRRFISSDAARWSEIARATGAAVE
ncbi:hypothetical protein UB46_13165 [Burkholderiaceae bacterium 16]|nr:hypothetical protein UB46_13165 [Burkholderiaceae bacterium 16]